MDDKQGDLDVSGAYINPPPVNMDSDENSASEDEREAIDNLTGRQLRAFKSRIRKIAENCRKLQKLL